MDYMKISSLFALMFVLVIFYHKQKQAPTVAQVMPKLDTEALLKSLRKISFENHTDENASFTLTLFTPGDEPLVTEHMLPANDSGWIPYFVSGTLQIEYDTQKLDIDISQVNKEYIITVDSNYVVSHSIKDLTELD